ncbi:hypothetical protein H1C71_009350, partial [Ictidomys tridecemlineatus]
ALTWRTSAPLFSNPGSRSSSDAAEEVLGPRCKPGQAEAPTPRPCGLARKTFQTWREMECPITPVTRISADAANFKVLAAGSGVGEVVGSCLGAASTCKPRRYSAEVALGLLKRQGMQTRFMSR